MAIYLLSRYFIQLLLSFLLLNLWVMPQLWGIKVCMLSTPHQNLGALGSILSASGRTSLRWGKI